MQVHELKTLTPYFEAVLHGKKKFELRKNDRGFQVGDILQLIEYDPYNDAFDSRGCSGRVIQSDVIYVLRDAEPFGLKRGYVILGLGQITVEYGRTWYAYHHNPR